MTKERIAVLIAAVTIVTSCGKQGAPERRRTQDATNDSIDCVVATVPTTEPQRIDASPLFTLLWKSAQGSPAKPSDYPVGDIVSRMPSRALFVLPPGRGNVLRILDPKTGVETAQATLPEAVSQTHRRLDGEPGMWGDFAYATCRDGGDARLLVKATQDKRHGTTSSSGIGTALYGCTLDGRVLWTFLGKLTHNTCVVPIDDQSDIIVVEQGCDEIVLLSVGGKELARITTPTFDHIEISTGPVAKAVTLYLLADNIYCYALVQNLLEHQRNTQPKPDGDGKPAP